MADLEPFRALRPRPELAARVAAPPYDVISSRGGARAGAPATSSPSSTSRSRRSTSRPTSTSTTTASTRPGRREPAPADRRRRAASARPSPRFYVYQQTHGRPRPGRARGAAPACDEYEDGLIKKHEHTRTDKEDDRTRHVDELERQRRAGLPHLPRAARRSTRSWTTIRAGAAGLRLRQRRRHRPHRSGSSREPARVAALGAALRRGARALRRRRPPPQRRRPPASACARRPPTRRTAATSPTTTSWPCSSRTTSCRSWTTTGWCKDLGGLTPKQFLARVGEKFDGGAGRERRARAPRQFGMFLGGTLVPARGEAGHLSRPTTRCARSTSAILQENLLAPVLGIADPRTDKRIDFVGGIRGIGELEKRVPRGLGGGLRPLSRPRIEQLMAVADAGQVMPPKSTWFEPKLRSGLLVRHLAD